MTYTTVVVQEFLADLFPFNQLSPAALHDLERQGQILRYRIGQPVIGREVMPTHVSVLFQGQIRLLGFGGVTPITLEMLEPGQMVGWVSLVRGVPCEMAIASTESVCFNLPAESFLKLLQREPSFAVAFRDRPGLVEVFEGVRTECDRRALAIENFQALVQTAYADATVKSVAAGASVKGLPTERLWLLSGGALGELQIGDRVDASHVRAGSDGARLLGLRTADLFPDMPTAGLVTPAMPLPPDWQDSVPYAPEELGRSQNEPISQKFPIARGKGELESTLACFQMICQYFDMPFRRDTVRRIVASQLSQNGRLSVHFCGAIAESMGLTTQLIQVPASALSRVQTPALIAYQDGFAVLYQSSDKALVLGVPEMGIRRPKPKVFAQTWGDRGEVLLLQPTKDTPKQRFSLRWFIPAIHRHRKVLIEVFIASVFVQLLGLANPLITQLIIDKVLNQNSLDALTVLGIFLVGVSVVEAVLGNIRTHLFVDTTNRIDLSLSSEVIQHLLRLPLNYFEKRPVGELASRVNELEHIRQFLTGTALTVVLDSLFSVIYILVMVFYSPILTIVSLATVPLFALLTLIVSPLIRRQSREKAEEYASTNSYLVETLTGIQTVKAQNLELRSRWQWQDRYADYISAGFKTISTQTTAGALSGFLNKLSSLLVLWAGAYLVLTGSMTLGQLIAFRIIAGYVTSPLLRLVQLWQNFQETALSIERLGDVLDATPEQPDTDQQNILMPAIQGRLEFDHVSFGFKAGGPLQLRNINLTIPARSFVGIVGQSGSGKSTLTKLIPRLYEPAEGKIIIDGYDISKVELYSLRRQIGMVLQDTLLFDGTIRDNITIANPEASDEQIIEAAKIAHAHDFIMSLPSGYNTRVGERGSALSGGQRQRVAIARTVLQDPHLLILDEATSALDYNSERQVCRNLAEACRDRTVLFITHRLSSIRNADVILMMDQGLIVEHGTHEELMALQGYYYCLYQQQDSKI